MKWSLVLLLIACSNGAVIEPGTYHVKHTVVYSNDPFSTVGDTFEADWKLTEHDGKYKAKLTNAELEGAGSDDLVVLSSYERLDWCPYAFNRMNAELYPVSYGFEGEAFSDLFFCATYDPSGTYDLKIENWSTEFRLETK